jgi:PAS domain S-box-containing protein
MEDKRLTILAIDDHQDNLTAIKAVVGSIFPDAQILSALSGQQGLALARSADPDVILLDIIMPRMDGYETCRQLKRAEETRHIPVVFLTALKADKQSRMQALEAGAEGFLTKPIDDVELTVQIQAMAKIKAMNALQQKEKQRLNALVMERTAALAKELEEHRIAEQKLRQVQQRLEKSQTATLNLLEDLKAEIEARKQTENELRESEERLRTVVQNMPVMLDAFDENGTLVAWNRECERVSGYHAAEMIGNPQAMRMIYSGPNELEALLDRFNKVSKPFFGVEQELTCKDGTRRVIAWSNISNEFPIQGWFNWSIGFDVTERKNIENELREERQSLAQKVAERTAELQHALRTKDEFLANMSHELRTPLTAILGMSEVLETELRGPLNDNQKHYVNSIYQSGQHLLNLINDILDMAKIEADRLTLEKEAVSIQDVCENSLMFIRESASRRSLKVQFEKTTSVDNIEADPRRLKQILINLLGNAVKFTPEGGTIGLQVADAAESKEVCFTVWDTGIGISNEDQQRLFQPFVQVESSLNRRYEGTGLGLSLVARLTELHGGRVNLDSQPGQGTRITVNLPRGAVPDKLRTLHQTAPLPSLPPHELSSRRRVLLTEDNPLTVQTMLAYLQSRNFETLVAYNGQQALEIAEQQKPDLILMDIQIPGIDGLETIRRLRRNPRTSQIPIIAITALVMPGDREKCLEAGANRYLSKPVRFKDLEKDILALLPPLTL